MGAAWGVLSGKEKIMVNTSEANYPTSLPLPALIVDTREKTPLEFQHLEVEHGTLTTGDYSIKGFTNSFMVERKSMADLVGSLTQGRERFFRELERMRGAKFARLLIIGTKGEFDEVMRFRRVNEESIVGSLAWINANLVPVARAASTYKAAQMVERWACYFYAGAARPFGRVSIPAWCREGVI